MRFLLRRGNEGKLNRDSRLGRVGAVDEVDFSGAREADSPASLDDAETPGLTAPASPAAGVVTEDKGEGKGDDDVDRRPLAPSRGGSDGIRRAL